MNKSNKFSPEVLKRAVRLVQDHRAEYPSLRAAVESIAPKIGCVPQILLEWVKLTKVDAGTRLGTTTVERSASRTLSVGTRSCGETTIILRTASAFFAQAELDRKLNY